MTFLERMGFDTNVDVETEDLSHSLGIIVDDKEIAQVPKSTELFRVMESSIIRGVSIPIKDSEGDEALCFIMNENGQATLKTEKEQFLISEYELVLLCLAICREVMVPKSTDLEAIANKGAILKFVDDKLKSYQKDCYLH